MRIRVESKPIRFNDHVQGRIEQDLARDIGDFVLRRADGIHAYQLAVVVDDADQGVTHVVRGADLTLSTPRQLYLQRALELPTPEYAHLPLAVDRHGRKLSKSSASAPVDPASPLSALQRAWAFLGQPPLAEDLDCLGDFWAEAIAEWDRSRVPPLSRRSLVEPEIG